ncbi:hypothetical protein SLEP1_g52317 [Rubroshorea leprosula]|uniref:F-box domain-containing protein n=1 Tax=Rubroshorea leprosula TaxID=152421 RepID=A0AAV5M7M7_9ROSI|nr:hypothetical protein SLEP1_g52317 [Rubroshorea leprosula]
MSALSPELVTEILLRLPVSSLLRFRCLSTSLCTEIDSENFVRSHLNRSIQTKTRQKLIVYNPRFKGPSGFYYADFDDDLVDAFPLNKPLISRHRGTSVYGSCNGLILLGMDFQVKSMDLAIWNPFTRRYKSLPPCPVQTLPEHGGFMSSGLGYDSAHDDYKIVIISKVHDSNRVFSQVWVFGLRSDFWRRSRDLEDEVTTSVGRFANGALYWVCKNKGVGFDVAKEVFFDIPLLAECAPAPFFFDSFDSLVVFGGNLYFRKLHGETVEFYLLVSDVSDKSGEEVVGVSWRKEFTLHDLFPLWPLAYSKDGDSILIGDLSGVFWHNLENKTNQRVNIPRVPKFFLFGYRYNVCWESLVSVGKDSAFDGAAEEMRIDDLDEEVEQFEADIEQFEADIF